MHRRSNWPFQFYPFESFRCVGSNIFGAFLLRAGLNFMVNTIVILCISMRSGLPGVYEKVTTNTPLI